MRVVLYRHLYRGEIIWGQKRKRNPWGVSKASRRPEGEWVRLSAPELRIVSDELWAAAHGRLKVTRDSYLRSTKGRLWGRPASGLESKYLLTGLAQCDTCGGSLFVRSRQHGRQRVFFYGCTTYHLRGHTACTNHIEVPMEATDRAVLTALEEKVLRPDVLVETVRKAVARFQSDGANISERRHSLSEEVATVEKELTRLTEAVAQGGNLSSLIDAIKEREQRRTSLQASLSSLSGLESVKLLDERRLERDLSLHLAEQWQGLLTRHTLQARQIVRKLLVGRLRFIPYKNKGQRGYTFTGESQVGRILAGVTDTKKLVSPTGFEPVLPA